MNPAVYSPLKKCKLGSVNACTSGCFQGAAEYTSVEKDRVDLIGTPKTGFIKLYSGLNYEYLRRGPTAKAEAWFYELKTKDYYVDSAVERVNLIRNALAGYNDVYQFCNNPPKHSDQKIAEHIYDIFNLSLIHI